MPNEQLSRRDFIKAGLAATALGGGALALQNHPLSNLAGQPATFQSAAGQSEQVVKTTCALCPSGCGLDVRVVNGKAVKIDGSALHPLNQGVCCLKGQAALEILYSPERLHHPRMRIGERGSPNADWKEISWDEALQILAGKLQELRAAGQAHSVAVLHGELRGQMRGLVGRFMQAYGSPNLISRDSLGEGASRLAMLLSQGVNGLPVYDLNNCNYVLAFGGNLLESSRNVIAYLGAAAFMRRGRPQRGKLVAIHPRLSLTGAKADEWVPLRPGTYAALALGIANVIINSELYDENFIRNFTFGFEDFEDADGVLHQGFKSLVLQEYTLERVSKITGVPTETIARLAGEFATNRPAVAVLPAEIGELNSGNSLYTALAIHALNALVGSIDNPGGVLVQRFPEMADWPAYTPDQAALKSLNQPRLDRAGSRALSLAGSVYQNTSRQILVEQPYPIQLLMLLNANPVYDAPNQSEFTRALLKVPFVVSFSSLLDESAAHADLILPASTFLEIWGDDFMEGTGYPGISLRQPVVQPVHDTRNPGDIFLHLAHKLGGTLNEALPWKDYQSLVQYRLSKVGNLKETRTGADNPTWQKMEENGFWAQLVYFNAAPGSQAWGEIVGRDRLNAPKDGRFDFFSRELFAILRQANATSPADLDCLPHFELPSISSGGEEGLYPFLLITQGLITQSPNWSGIVPTLQESYGLQSHIKWGSWVEMNHRLGHALGLEDNDWVWVESPVGRVKTQVRLYDGLWPNAVFIPSGMGHFTGLDWGKTEQKPALLSNILGEDTSARQRRQIGVNVNELIYLGTEKICGQAISNPTRVRIYKA
jgi:anaerobic selenocysteine-containing dehydrogenase